MSSEAFSRALMSIGDSLGDMANYRATNEREQARMMHEESITRLREQLAGKRQDKNQEFTAAENEANRAAQAEQTRIREEGANTRSQNALSIQDRRLNESERRQVERAGNEYVAQLADRSQQLRDQLNEFKAEGMVADPTVLEEIQKELEAVEFQKLQARRRTVAELASMGDPRYKDMNERELLNAAGWNNEQSETWMRAAGLLDEPDAEAGTDTTTESETTEGGAVSTEELDRVRPPARKSRSRSRSLMEESAMLLEEPPQQAAAPDFMNQQGSGNSFLVKTIQTLKDAPLWNEQTRQANRDKVQQRFGKNLMAEEQ